MIASKEIRYHPAILHLRHLTRQFQLPVSKAVLEHESMEKLIDSMTAHDSLEAIFTQQLYGPLSTPFDGEQASNDPARARNKAQRPVTTGLPDLTRAIHTRSHQLHTKSHQLHNRKPGSLAERVTEPFETSNKTAPQKEMDSTDAIACVERLWEKWLNNSAATKESLTPDNKKTNVQNSRLISALKNTRVVHKNKLHSAEETDQNQTSAHLIHALQSAFAQITHTQFRRNSASTNSTQMPAQNKVILENKVIAENLQEDFIAKSLADTSTQTSGVAQAALSQLVDKLWSIKADTKILNTRSTYSKSNPTANTPKTAAESAQPKHHFHSEIQDLVKKMALKPVDLKPSEIPDDSITDQSGIKHQSSLDLDENEIVDTVNRVLREQALRNGAFLP